MRCLPFLLVAITVTGCSRPAADNGASASNTISEPEKVYAWQILDKLDRFSKIAEDAQRVDNDDALAYMKTKKPTPAMLDHLRKGNTDAIALIKEMKALQPPTRFQAFHDQAVKNTEQKAENLAGLLLAMEHNDKAEIAKVLDSIETTGKKAKEAMDKILQGKTAEAYLGVAP